MWNRLSSIGGLLISTHQSARTAAAPPKAASAAASAGGGATAARGSGATRISGALGWNANALHATNNCDIVLASISWQMSSGVRRQRSELVAS